MSPFAICTSSTTTAIPTAIPPSYAAFTTTTAASSTGLLGRRATIVTETLFRAPPSPLPKPHSGNESRIPIGAIAGGVVAGALLAVFVTIGWVWWGRSIDRAAAMQRIEANKEIFLVSATRRNTIRNAGGQGISRPRPQGAASRYRALHGRSLESEKQVKFATVVVAGPMALALSHDEKEKEKEKPAGGGAQRHLAPNGHRPLQQRNDRLQVPPPATRSGRGSRGSVTRVRLSGPGVGSGLPPSSSAAARAVNGSAGRGHGHGHSGRGNQLLQAEMLMDENRGRRFGADVERNAIPVAGEGQEGYLGASGSEEQQQMRRTPSNLLLAALGRLSPSGGEREVVRRSSRWSWTSSLDLKIFGRANRASGAEERSDTDGASSRYVPMGVAL
ncbi:hypothetical protein DFP72DRAFT_1058737 [Ephemerocybe angulata]|uniref:Uncharacterized protein n=1 Tax=Ephemerocybe angulata TaxID=980116 RepID=A0A8H6MGK0_9AGAR|nr:hypothetical protein DFP72DRAFT_1058737 [Tulosesus angulatus]